jgi:hypothetical protein
VTTRSGGLTIFAAPRPFAGEFERIQVNAVHSWAALQPKPEILLFGQPPPARLVGTTSGVEWVPTIASTSSGAPRLDVLFREAQRLASNNTLAYVNPDVILLQDAAAAMASCWAQVPDCVIVGAPWNVKVDLDLDGPPALWSGELNAMKSRGSCPTKGSGADLFAFRSGAFDPVPPLAIGRLGWDNWLLWRAVAHKGGAVDITNAVALIHQDHSGTTHRGSLDETHRAFEDDVRSNLAALRWWETIARRSEIPHVLRSDGRVVRRWKTGRGGAIATIALRHARLTATPFLTRKGLAAPIERLRGRRASRA